ncbi:MAG: hypothetical protein H6581_16890 [Bacteroidia bacterium]|nr:hypothetical protein [Bacteroidia bacterium]
MTHFLAKNILFLWILASFISCKNPAPQASFDRDLVAREAEKMLQDYHTSIEKDGLLAEFAFLDSSEAFFWAPPGLHSAVDYDSIRTLILQIAPSLQKSELEWKSLKVIPLSEEFASYTGIISATNLDTAGNSNHSTLIESGTLIKRADGWKILNGQTALLPEETQIGYK